MSARIAPEPVTTSTTTDLWSRGAPDESRAANDPGGPALPQKRDAGAEARHERLLPPLPAPPDPPGTMFAAAVVAGALSPKPETPQEIFLRLGRSWSPPTSELHLADRTI